MMKKQNYCWTILLLMMSVSLGTLQAQTTYKIQTYPDGSKYAGEFKNGKRHGKGTKTYSDGMKYVGKQKDGFEHGKGSRTYSDGDEMKDVIIDGELVGQQFED